MKKEPIGYLKFNNYVDQLVDNQIWMQQIESFRLENQSIKGFGAIQDSQEGKVEVLDGFVDYTELLDFTQPNLKSKCYIASFTGLYKEDFTNKKIKKQVVESFKQFDGGRDFALMKAKVNGTNSLEDAINTPELMSPRIVDSTIPLGYLDSTHGGKNSVQQIIMYDANAKYKKIDVDVTADLLRNQDSKYVAARIMIETTKKDAADLIRSLGIKRIAKLIKDLEIDTSGKIMRNMNMKYIRRLKHLLSKEKYRDLKKVVNQQRDNPLRPAGLKICLQYKAVKYTNEKITKTKKEVLKRAKECEKYRQDLLKKCFFQKREQYAYQQECRIVLVASQTKEEQRIPSIMYLQFYKRPLIPDEEGTMQYLQPIQSKKVSQDSIKELRESWLTNLGKTITVPKTIGCTLL